TSSLEQINVQSPPPCPVTRKPIRDPWSTTSAAAGIASSQGSSAPGTSNLGSIGLARGEVKLTRIAYSDNLSSSLRLICGQGRCGAARGVFVESNVGSSFKYDL